MAMSYPVGDGEAMILPRGSAQPRVVILGGGFGGLHAANALKHAPVQVTLIDENNHHTFQPLLYQVATAGLEPPDIALPLRSLMRRHKNTTVLMAEAESIDAAARVVHLVGGDEVAFDYLILAVGARSSYVKPKYRLYAPSLKSIADAFEMRYRVLSAFELAEREPDVAARRALLTFIVVGGGPTGVELAGAIAELARHALKDEFRHIDPTSAHVILMQGGPSILPAYPPGLRASAQKQLESLGVEVRTSGKVGDIDEHGVFVGSEHIAARTVLWGGGVTGTAIAHSLGTPIDRHGRIEVDSQLNPPGMRHVFVVGDAALLTQDGAPIPGVAPAAIQGGRYAARAILKRIAGRELEPFRYRFKGELATIGRARAVASLPFGIKLSGFFAWALYLTVHLFYLSGFRTRISVFFTWIWFYLTWARGARMIPSHDKAMYVREIVERYEVPSLEEPQPPAPH